MKPDEELIARWMALPYLAMPIAKLRELIAYESNVAMAMVIEAGLSRYRQ